MKSDDAVRRVLLDTNLYVSFLLNSTRQGAIFEVIDRAFRGEFLLLLPLELTAELVRAVAAKPYLRAGIRSSDLDELMGTLLAIAEPTPPFPGQIPVVSRDPDDNYLLAAAIVSDADYLVTGDKDLLALRSFFVGKPLILTPAEFLAILDQGLNNSSAER